MLHVKADLAICSPVMCVWIVLECSFVLRYKFDFSQLSIITGFGKKASVTKYIPKDIKATYLAVMERI